MHGSSLSVIIVLCLSQRFITMFLFCFSKALKTYNSWKGPLVHPCEVTSTKRYTPEDDPITLEPGVGNIHEIQSKPE